MFVQTVLPAIFWGAIFLAMTGCGQPDQENSQLNDESGVSFDIAGIKDLLTSSDDDTAPQVLGHAIPDDSALHHIRNSITGSRTFNKLLESTLGFDLVKVVYKIEYEFAGLHPDHPGHYLTNVTFVPLEVETDPLWSVKAKAYIAAPKFHDSATGEPYAVFRFGIKFTADGIGSQARTDEFVLNGATGELSATIRDFE